jgi:hypothetical protein
LKADRDKPQKRRAHHHVMKKQLFILVIWKLRQKFHIFFRKIDQKEEAINLVDAYINLQYFLGEQMKEILFVFVCTNMMVKLQYFFRPALKDSFLHRF